MLYTGPVIPAKLVPAKAGSGNPRVHKGPVRQLLPPTSEGGTLSPITLGNGRGCVKTEWVVG
jgi:hypothetical protein